MAPLTLSVCSRCCHSLLGTQRESWTTLTSLSLRCYGTGSQSRSPDTESVPEDLGSSSRTPVRRIAPVEDFDTQRMNSKVTMYMGPTSRHNGLRAQSRHALFESHRESCTTLASLSFRRHRTGSGSSKSRRDKVYAGGPNRLWSHHDDRRPESSLLSASPQSTSPRVDPNNIPAFFESQVERWSTTRGLQRRFESFGIPLDEVKPLLRAFVHAVQSGALSTPDAHERYTLLRFAHHSPTPSSPDEPPPFDTIDTIYSTILFAWAGDPAHAPLLAAAGLAPPTITRIQGLARASDRSYPAEEFPEARKIHRKVIMHVGPTNSGKTHNALRALAAAEAGVYAGPLRLLAHEIWERLNLGQIVPLGVKEEVEEETVRAPVGREAESALDIGGGEAVPAVRRLGNPKYVRMCNMITGEEQKIVAETATLVACTVEMLNFSKQWDVAVVDEIQMIADEGRGSAWTRAVLGMCAKEVHLCGEETAVPVVRELLKDTGDELVVHRYERLSPLEVEEESLEGDFSRVRKGDCIVTFSRSNIFAIKRRIESMTSMRCAVVYGMLPPEIRSEQAALFNDPDSGYDVIIGSDAIGMGLNLKIRRIVFEAVRKWDGASERPLSVSQTKQIAGRAGRYGMHSGAEPCGYTTALFPSDVAFIRKTLALPVPPLPFARIGPTKESFSAFALALPPSASTQAIFDAHQYISQLPPTLRYTETGAAQLREICAFVDTRGARLPLSDRLLLIQAPVAWRDAACMELVARFVGLFQVEMDVDLGRALEGSEFVVNLERTEERMRGKEGKKRATSEMLGSLESFHKALVLYVWMSFRQPVVWHSHEEVAALKARVEKALDWALQALTRNHPTDKGWKEHLETQRVERAKQIPYSGKREIREQQERKKFEKVTARA